MNNTFSTDNGRALKTTHGRSPGKLERWSVWVLFTTRVKGMRVDIIVFVVEDTMFKNVSTTRESGKGHNGKPCIKLFQYAFVINWYIDPSFYCQTIYGRHQTHTRCLGLLSSIDHGNIAIWIPSVRRVADRSQYWLYPTVFHNHLISPLRTQSLCNFFYFSVYPF